MRRGSRPLRLFPLPVVRIECALRPGSCLPWVILKSMVG